MNVRLDVEVETARTQRNAFVMHPVDPGLAGLRAIEHEMQTVRRRFGSLAMMHVMSCQM